MPNQISSKTIFYYELIKSLDLKARSELISLLSNERYGSSNALDESAYNISNNAVSEQVINDIDIEIDALNDQIKEKFLASAEQLKKLLVNEFIKNTPDVLMFNKGYVGLIWETKDDGSIFVYSIPDGSLFYNKVGINFSETRTLEANKNNFAYLIKMINLMV